MLQVKADEEWNVSGSEDEAEQQTGSRSGPKTEAQDSKKRKKRGINIDMMQQLPVNVAMLYKEIEKNGVLDILCKCPRRGPSKKDSQSQNSQSSSSSVMSKLDNCHIATGQSPTKPKIRPEYQGFDYKDDEERPFVNKGVSAKKTPVSGKRSKKIASMANVVNDLIRHKMLDDLENTTPDPKDVKKAKGDDKETKVTLDFESQDSMPDIKEGIASQINRVETMLDSKEGKKLKGKDK